MPDSIMNVDILGNVATCVIHRPPVNAFDYAAMKEITQHLHDLAANESLSVVVIKGEGRGFSAGADLRASSNDRQTYSAQDRESTTTGFFRAFYGLPCATIAALHGYAVGAGLGIASLCDIRIATEDTIFSMPEIKWGVSVGGGGSKITRLGVRTGVVRELLLTGREFSAAEAHDTGLIDYVVASRADLDAKVDGLVAQLADKDVTALRLVKLALNVAEKEGEWERGYIATKPLAEQLSGHMNSTELFDSFQAVRRS